MVFHVALALKERIPTRGAPLQTQRHDSDMELLVEAESVLGEEIDMVRMFRRFLRSGGRPRVVGGWNI